MKTFLIIFVLLLKLKMNYSSHNYIDITLEALDQLIDLIPDLGSCATKQRALQSYKQCMNEAVTLKNRYSQNSKSSVGQKHKSKQKSQMKKVVSIKKKNENEEKEEPTKEGNTNETNKITGNTTVETQLRHRKQKHETIQIINQTKHEIFGQQKFSKENITQKTLSLKSDSINVHKEAEKLCRLLLSETECIAEVKKKLKCRSINTKTVEIKHKVFEDFINWQGVINHAMCHETKGMPALRQMIVHHSLQECFPKLMKMTFICRNEFFIKEAKKVTPTCQNLKEMGQCSTKENHGFLDSLGRKCQQSEIIDLHYVREHAIANELYLNCNEDESQMEEEALFDHDHSLQDYYDSERIIGDNIWKNNNYFPIGKMVNKLNQTAINQKLIKPRREPLKAETVESNSAKTGGLRGNYGSIFSVGLPLSVILVINY